MEVLEQVNLQDASDREIRALSAGMLQKFAISQEILRSYFPVNRVIDGLFAITEKLYNVTIKQRNDAQVWHKDVMFFDILNQDGKSMVVNLVKPSGAQFEVLPAEPMPESPDLPFQEKNELWYSF